MASARKAILQAYLRHACLVVASTSCLLEAYGGAHLVLHPAEYRFGTEVAGIAFQSPGHFLMRTAFLLALLLSSIAFGMIYQRSWWPPLAQIAVVTLTCF